nr:non-ribosomal peptide synthetase [Rhodococcus sp. (in: high G+C Gram-positive bacteria)]
MKHESGSVRRAPVTARADRTSPIPLSLAQQRMWFLNRLDPDSSAHNVPVTIRLTGELDVAAFAEAFLDVTARHDILRTVYPDIDGVGRQVIDTTVPSSVVLHVEEIDPARTADRALEMVAAGFDVTADIPVRAALLVESPTSHVLVVVAHHISIDGFSIGPLTRDLVRAYAARATGLEPGWSRPAVQYADYAVWQRRSLGSEDDPTSIAFAQIGYWTAQLADLPVEIELPADRPRPVEESTRAAAVTVALDAEVRTRTTSLAHSVGATPFMVMHAALAVFLSRLSATTDIVIGTPVAGRGERELDDMIGMFVNTLVLRTAIDPAATFLSIVHGVRETDLSAFAYADMPFEQIVDALDPPRVRGRHPLFQVMFTFQNLAQAHLELPDLTISGMELDAARAKFDLQVTVSDAYEDGALGGWNVEFTYAADLFDRSTVLGFAAGYRRLLSGLLDNPDLPIGDIESMPPAERDLVVLDWSSSGPAVEPADFAGTLVDRFSAAVVAFPNRVAVRFDGTSLTYRELSARVDVLARVLISFGAQPETLVAVALPRTAELVVALLAVSVSGAGYLPIDPTYPRDRIDFMLADAAPIAILTAGATEDFDVPVIDLGSPDLDNPNSSAESRGAVTNEDRTSPLTGANLAYVIYTSGSSGRPKGVAVTHENVLRLFDNTASGFRFDSTDVWTMFHSYAFDFSVWEMWGPLLHGGSLVVVDYYTSRSPETFRELLASEGVTVLNQTPSAFHQLAEVDRILPPAPLSLRYVLFGGEALEPRRLANWFSRHGDGTDSGPALVNLYGITETTVHVSLRPLTARDVRSASVIGVPIAGLRVYVLNRRLHPVPIGVAGEMYVAGGQLARGYLGRSDLSATRFVADPFGTDGRVLYRTGDRARWIHGAADNGRGELEYLGRIDDQVKVRGFRIELGEVETAVSALPSVTSVAVVVRDVPPAGDTLVAYVVLADDSTVDVEDLRRGVAAWVPEHMVPSAFVPIDKIPLTVNGKLDRTALPAPTFVVSEFRAPSNPVEQVVAGVFADVLGVERIGADDDFFALGGNSLVATRVASRLGVALDTTVALRLLFEASTVAELAARLQSDIGAGGRAQLVARSRPDTVPLSFAQQRMWFLNRLDPTSRAYNISLALRLHGSVDEDALAMAIEDVITRHEPLRTRYPDVDGVGSQEIVALADLRLDLAPEPVVPSEAIDRVRSLAATSFDVTAAVPLLVRVLRLSADEHMVVLVVHHIAADGFSLGPLTRDMMTAYAARSQGGLPGWEPLEVQYADYILWHREILGDQHDPTSILAVQQNFWRNALDGLGKQTGILPDRPRPAARSGVGATHEFEIGSELLDSIEMFAREHNSSPFMVLHTAVAILLARSSGDEDIAIGTPVAGRGESQLDGVVGMFVNTLVLRLPVRPADTITEVLRAARETDLESFAQSDVPFDRIVELLDPPRSAAMTPFFQVVVALQNHGTALLDLPGLTISGMATADHVATHDLQFVFSSTQSDDGASSLGCTIVYATDLYERATVATVADNLLTVLRTLSLDPNTIVAEIDLATTMGEEPILDSWPISPTRLHLRTLSQVLDASVDAEASAPLLVENGTETAYLDVAEQVARTARYLISQGVGPGGRVVIELPPTIEYVVALWAVWSAGAAVVFGAAQPVDVVLTATESMPGGSVDSRRVIALDAGDVAKVIASHSSRPVDYASRTHDLVPETDAFVVVEDGSETVLSHGDASALAVEFAHAWDMTYESRLMIVRRTRSATADAWFAFGVLVAVSEGAAIVVDGGDSDVESMVERDWVSHIVAESSVVLGVDESEIDLVIRTDEVVGAPWAGRVG